MKPTQAYQGIFFNILKFGLAFGTIGFIAYKLVYTYHIGELWSQATSITINIQTVLFFFICLFLMPINWLLEAEKWKVIMSHHETVSNTQAYKSVLVGVTLGIITPNQIGDLAGKSIYLQTLPKLKGAAANLLGGIAQIISTFVLGSYALAALFCFLNEQPISVLLLIFLILTIINGVCIWGFINIRKIKLFTKWDAFQEYLSMATQYNAVALIKLLGYSACRFLVFTFQYYLLLQVFGINLTLAQWLMSIFSLYVMQIVAPTFFLVQIGVRGALALYFIGFFSTNTVAILQASYSLWILNMIIPALIGLYLLLTLKHKSTS